MYKILSFLFITLLFSPSAYSEELQLGAPITLTEVTKVSEINADPEKYTGKKVLIEGVIINVCAARGCWMDIASDVPFEKIQITSLK